jgi:hypothetical protein
MQIGNYMRKIKYGLFVISISHGKLGIEEEKSKDIDS